MIAFFHKIVDALNENEIPYMLTGSIAMGVYILPRATRDFDFVVHFKPGDVERFVSNFTENYYLNLDSVIDAVKRHSIFNIIDHASGYKADFIVTKNEGFRKEEFNRRVQMKFFEKTIYLVSVEDLILSKIIWIQELQSAIQMDDIINLCQLDSLDWVYLHHWINKLNLKTFDLLQS